MTVGKPGPEQLDLSADFMLLPNDHGYLSENGVDCRNYAGLDGIPEIRRLFGELLDVDAADVIVGDNASLQVMHDALMQALLLGPPDGEGPWFHRPDRKFLCPSPGFDRHFTLTEKLGFELITIPLTGSGPDMDMIERFCAEDDSIKGIWCVPKYSNPTGETYSADVVRRFATMKAAPDFRIIWDNAYVEHHLGETTDELDDLYQACIKAGNPNRTLLFASTSKITFAGAGVGAMAASAANREAFKSYLTLKTIGPNKLNQLRHAQFLPTLEHVRAHMKKHAALLRPKFDRVVKILEQELVDTDIAQWTRPNGGYFISFDAPTGCAREIVALADAIGVQFTQAGCTYPYRTDPDDRNIRIAPTLPSLEAITTAMRVLAVCTRLVHLRKQHTEQASRTSVD
jgi:DNA-binding transcriptional MocR family regulator